MIDNNKKTDVGFIWKITDDVLRDTFRKNEIGDVLLPFIVIRRLDCMLEPVYKEVRSTYEQFHGKLEERKLIPVLRKAAGGLKFYNTSKHTLSSLKDEPQYIQINFNNYCNGFNPEVREILENFQFANVVGRLVKNKLLFELIDAICKIDLHIEKVSNHDMGYIFEELIRISNEQSNETAGEHFTPRDVISLMNSLLFINEKQQLSQPGIIRTIYDPTCGTGGMVNLGKKHILNDLLDEIKSKPSIKCYGQEINEQSYAIAKSEALITGEDANNIKHGNTFTDDQFPGKSFHYMMANPPYGVNWKRDAAYIKNEVLNPAGRFSAGHPRTSDGQLLFLQHMISKMEREGSRIAVVTNGSPLFTGGAGSGESDIRKWIIENDWLECIVSMPGELFYNTGISTYIWILTNDKEARRKGKIQLINAAAEEITTDANGKENETSVFCQTMRKSLGNKRNEFKDSHIQAIQDIYTKFEESEHCKIFDNDDFGYYQITVEQPEKDDNGKIILKKGEPKADSKLRDQENVPLKEDIEKYFDKEVVPHLPEAWVDYDKTRIGYEINFTKYFYKYKPLRASTDIAKDLLDLKEESENLLKQIID